MFGCQDFDNFDVIYNFNIKLLITGIVFFEIKKMLILDEMAGNDETLNQECCSLWPLVVWLISFKSIKSCL
jgi:hypothetical protein